MQPERQPEGGSRGFFWTMVSLAIIGTLLMGTYLIYAFSDYELKSVVKWVAIIAGSALALLLAGWGLWAVVRSRPEKGELIKEIVDTDTAARVWIEAFIRNTGIPHIEHPWEEDEKLRFAPVNPDAVRMNNERRYTDPGKETADYFFKFQVRVVEGKRKGVHTVNISLDHGVEFIRKNWNMFIVDHTPMNIFKLHNNEYPLTSSKSARDRALLARIEAISEGYSASEIRESIDPFIEQLDTAPQHVSQAAPSRVVRRPRYADEVVEAGGEDEGESASDELEEHIADVRRKNR